MESKDRGREPSRLPERDLAHVLDGILALATAATGASAGAIYLVNDDDGDLVLAAARGLPAGAIGHRVVAGKGPIGTAVQEGRSVSSHDVTVDPRAQPRRADWDETGVRAFLGLPLRTGERVIGALELTSLVAEAFSPLVRGQAAILADAAALLIENTLLAAQPPPAALGSESLAAAPLGIATVDGRLYVSSANSTFCHLLGESLEAVVGRPVIGLLPALGRPAGRDALQAALHGAPGHLGSVRSTTAAGEAASLSISLLPMGDATSGRQGIMVIALDVSERNRLEAELRDRHAQAAEARDRLRAVVEVVSHEVRTPLTSVLGYAQLLEDRLDAPEDQRRRWAELVVEKARSMARLVTEFTDLARLGSDRFELRLEPTDLGALVRRVAADVAPMTPDHPIRVDVEAGPTDIVVDPERVEQVLSNLMLNAAKFWRDAGVIEVSVTADSDGVRVSVADRGPGVPADEHERIFEPFHRVPGDVTAGVAGTGLGLAISRGIAEAHGGRLTIADRPGGGAVFTVELPRRPRR